ncbi:MAG: porin [Henriciella sp.]
MADGQLSDNAALEDRIAELERSNAELRDMLVALMAAQGDDLVRVETVAVTEDSASSEAVQEETRFVGLNSSYTYDILDHAENVTTKQLLQLKTMQAGELDDRLTFGGQITAIADYQRSNREDKFGYLMRNPTSANQIGKDVSEAVIHSANWQTTARLTDDLTAYVELLYNPEQNFGSGTITSIGRNLTQIRRGYLLWGNLDKSPLYAAIGKMDVPFGLNDTVSPFTNSTVWHSFAGLAYGAKLGYFNNGLHVQAMAVQGGAQFRAANVPVNDTSVPSRINNFAIDANYTSVIDDTSSLMVGASYEAGSPYCQDYPIFHFNPCADNNPAYSIYTKGVFDKLTVIAEYAQTLDEWPGTQVPDPTNPLSVFEAEKTKSWGVGGRYALRDDLDASFEFSTFVAGPDDAPWERQNQWVAGLSYDLVDHVNLFGELTHVDGFAPLNFLTGGNFDDGSTWSDRDATTDLILLGIQAAF